MNLLSLFQPRSSAPVARERLQILLAHERSTLGGAPDLVETLREEILAVIANHLAIDRDKVRIQLDRGASVSSLEIDIDIPTVKGPLRLTS